MHRIELSPLIKQEESENNPTFLDIFSIAILGAHPMVQRLEHCSVPFTTSLTCEDEENTIPFSVLSSILSNQTSEELSYRDLRPAYAMVEWRLPNTPDSEYPIFKTPHRITFATSKITSKLTFAQSLDWAESLTAHSAKIAKSQQQLLYQRMTVINASKHPLKTTIPEKVCHGRRAGFHRRRRREPYSSVSALYQTKQIKIKDLRRRAEQHQQKTGDMSGLVRVMQMQRSLASERETTLGRQRQVQRLYSRASSSSLFSERLGSQPTSSVCSGSC